MRPRPAPRHDVPAELAPHPEVMPFATAPVEIKCRQGVQEYVARQVAFRHGLILFVDARTSQFGIARLLGGEGVEARQYPCARAAMLMFLSSAGAIDGE